MKKWLFKPKNFVPILVLLTGIIFNFILFLLINQNVKKLYEEFNKITGDKINLHHLNSRLIYLDEVLTYSVRMAVLTNDLYWEKRYREYEPQLNSTIKQIFTLAPGFYDKSGIQLTELANIDLVLMETQAINLLRQRKKEAARAILFSAKYEEKKRVYAAGIQKFVSTIEKCINTGIKSYQQRVQSTKIFNGLSLFLSILIWLGAVIVLKNYTQKQEETETKLRASEEYWRLLIANATDLITILAPDGTILYKSPAVERLLGYSTKDLINQNVFTYIHPEDKPRVFATFTSGLKHPDYTISVEFRIRHKDGSWRIFESVGKNLLTNPIVGGIIINSHDITDRKKAEINLRNSAIQWQTILNTINDSICLLDQEGKVIQCNDAMVKFLNKPRSIIYQQPCWELIHPTLVPNTDHPLIRMRTSFHRESTVLTYGNKIFNLIVEPVFDESQKLINAVQIITDISDRKRAEMRLRESEAKYRTLVEQIPAITYIASLDINKTISYISPQVKMLLGITQAEWVLDPRIWIKQIHPEDREITLNRLQQSYTTGEPFQAEYRMYTAAGKKLWVRDQAVLVRDEIGTPLFYQGLIFDITESKINEEKVRESREMLNALVNANPESAFLMDINWKVLIANEVVAQRLNISPSTLIGSNMYELLPEEVRTVRKNYVNEVVRSGKPVNFIDIRNQRMMDNYIYPICDDNNTVTQLAIFARDITELYTQEKRYKESEQKFHNLAEQSPNMIFINQQGKIVYVNDKCVEIMGYQKEEFYTPQFDFFNLIAPESRKLIKENFTKHQQGEEILPYEYSLITKTGERIEVIIATKLIDYAGDKDILGIVTDITERKKIETTLREKEEQYRILFNSVNDAIFVYPVDDHGKFGNFSEVNELASQLLGYTRTELLGLSPEILGTFYQTGINSFLTEKLQPGNWSRQRVKIRTKTNKFRQTEINVCLLHFRANKFVFNIARVNQRPDDD